MTVDAIFTPLELAEQVVRCASCKSPRVIADFCAGDGGLLRAASRSWPKAKLVATDLSFEPLKQELTLLSARLGKCDFLSAKSRRACKALRGTISKIDLVLLNPPFSYRGAKTVTVQIEEINLTCSPALAFVANSFPFLSSMGQIVAILPAGCIRSEKNDAAWEWLRQKFDISIRAINSRRTFSGFNPTTAIVQLKRHSTKTKQLRYLGSDSVRKGEPTVKLLRGSIPMYRYDGESMWKMGKIPFVHTTELQENMVDLKARLINSKKAGVKGEFVVIPRVGKPNVEKLARVSSEAVVFSDCILGIECGSKKLADKLFLALKQRWEDVAGLYQGTGAPYVTVREIAQLLRDSGFSVQSYHNGTSSGLFKKALSIRSTGRSSLLSAISKVEPRDTVGTNSQSYEML